MMPILYAQKMHIFLHIFQDYNTNKDATVFK